ncbi:MAG: RdgB/HAM1 family non-canonical purine NTP pyrophosphatase [Chitinophagaceae bacterium]|nr:RdgB/HAM1 family non-canonical purine NTP pyrophosphatase [Chitinophagaceae bacterium]
MQTLIFATHNANKAAEVLAVLGDRFRIITLKDAGIVDEIPEPHETLEANATEKSTTIHRLTGQNCFSEDTGLETEALHGEPGVKSARYAGEGRDFNENLEKLLSRLRSAENRQARFRTVISLILNGREYQFEGICPGRIIEDKRGLNGFGYDPVFIPDGSDKTFAEMTLEEKNLYSHRKKAMEKLITFLKQYNAQDQN